MLLFTAEEDDDISTAALIRELERHVTTSRETRARVASNGGLFLIFAKTNVLG